MVAREASGPFGALIGVPESPQLDEAGDVRPLDAFRRDLALAQGRTLVMERAGDWQDTGPHTGAGGARLEHVRFGMDRELAR